jgi:23S rRNA pseudouridine2605 synthase
VALDRALSKQGMASRTEARALITAGRVTVDGCRRRRSGARGRPRARPDRDRRRAPRGRRRGHDPAARATRRGDDASRSRGRATAYELLRQAGPHLQAIGRLDLASRGLLLCTSDTRLSAALAVAPRRVTLRKRSGRETHLIVELVEGGTARSAGSSPRSGTM